MTAAKGVLRRATVGSIIALTVGAIWPSMAVLLEAVTRSASLAFAASSVAFAIYLVGMIGFVFCVKSREKTTDPITWKESILTFPAVFLPVIQMLILMVGR